MSDTAELLTNETPAEQVVESDVVENVVESVLESAAEKVVESEKVIEPIVDLAVEKVVESVIDKPVDEFDIIDRNVLSMSAHLFDGSEFHIRETLKELTPDLYREVVTTILEIVKDGKIDIKDIPNLIVVIKKVYQLMYNLKNMKFDKKKFNSKQRNKETGDFIKLIVYNGVINYEIKIEKDRQVEFLNEFDRIIDLCMELISLSKSLKPKGCLKKLFG
jgi:hypothetical protein